MPEFSRPAYLLLALLVPLVLWRWLRRPRGALRFPVAAFMRQLPAGRSQWARRVGVGLRAAALLALVVAAAGPRWPDVHTRVATEGVSIIMAVDVSGSMAEPDFKWDGLPVSRLEAVKRVFSLFVAGGEGPSGETFEGRPNDLIGLVTFATRPETACPLTLSHSVLLRLLQAERPRSVPTESETNLGDAVAWALARLENAPGRRKVIILLSDGEHNVPPPALKPLQAARLAAALHVPVYTIDAGGPAKPAEDPPSADKAAAQRTDGAQTLRDIARLSGGRWFRAEDAPTLSAVCHEVDRLERQAIQSFQYRRHYEGFPWFGLAAFVFLVTVQLLETTLWQRVP